MAEFQLITDYGRYKAGALLTDEAGDPIASLIANGVPVVPTVAALRATAQQVRDSFGGSSHPEWQASAALAALTCVMEEGTMLNARPAINFLGAGVTAVDDPTNNRINVTIAAEAVTGWTDGGTLVYPTTATDDVAVGVQAMEGTERLRVRNSVALVEALESINGGAGAQVGCTLATYFNRATAAVDTDVVARYSHFGHDDTVPANKIEFGRQDWVAEDVTAGTEDGSYALSVMVGGALTEVFGVDGALMNTPGDLVAGAAAMEGAERLRAVNSVPLVAAFETTDDGAVGCTISTHHRSAGPGDADVIARWDVYGEADAGVPTKTQFGRLDWIADDVSDGTEDASLSISLVIAGALTEVLGLHPTAMNTPGDLVVGAAAMEATERLRVVNSVPVVASFESTDADAVGATIETYHNSATPADADVIGRWSVFANNDNVAPDKTEFGRLDWIAADVGDGAGGSEDASLSISIQLAGVLTEVLTCTAAVPALATDIATKAYVDGAIASGGWKDSGGFAELFTTADTVVAGAVAMEGAEKFRIVHSTPLVLALETTDDGAVGCTISTHHRAAGPGDADVIMRWSMFGEADAGAPTKTEMARMECLVSDVSDTTEDAEIRFSTIKAGALTLAATIDELGALEMAGGLGLFGTAAPAAKSVHIADSAGDDAAAVNAILDVLELFGLVATV